MRVTGQCMNRRRYSVQRWLIRKSMADTRSSYHQQTVTTQRGRHGWGGNVEESIQYEFATEFTSDTHK